MAKDRKESGPQNELSRWSALEEGAFARHSDEKRALLPQRSSESGGGDGHRADNLRAGPKGDSTFRPHRFLAMWPRTSGKLSGLSFLVCEVVLRLPT